MKWNKVDRVNIVFLVKVEVGTCHHHYEFVVSFGAAFLGVDDECPVQPARDVLCKRECMAVI
jgi:hypothetical protein